MRFVPGAQATALRNLSFQPGQAVEESPHVIGIRLGIVEEETPTRPHERLPRFKVTANLVVSMVAVDVDNIEGPLKLTRYRLDGGRNQFYVRKGRQVRLNPRASLG
jgi:hypothetical protein